MPESQLGLQKINNPDDNALGAPGYPRSGVPYGYNATGEQTFQIRDVWHTVRKRIWLVLSIALIVTVIVTIEMFRAKTLYKSSAAVEVGRENAAWMKAGDLIIQSDDSSLVKTSILLLQSRPVLEEVASGLELDKNPEFLGANSKKSLWDAILTIGHKAISFGQPVSYPMVIKPTSVGSGAAKERTLDESRHLTPYVNYLRSIQTIDPVPETRVLTISYTHPDPAIAAALAQGTAQVFIQRGFQRQTQKFTSASDWLERTTGDLKQRVQEAERALSEYSRQHNIVNVGEGKGTFTSDKLAKLHNDTMRAETDRILKESLYEEVKKGNTAQLPEAFSDQKTDGLKTKLNELLTTAAQLGVKYGPENPKVIEVREQIKAIQQQIDDSKVTLTQRIKADYERAVRDEKTLKEALAKTKVETADENLANIQYDLLKQDVQTTKVLYTDFLQKTNQANLQVAEQENGYRIIEPAELGGAVGPNRLRVILISLFLSLSAGIGLTFFIEYLDNTIKSIDDVSKYVQLPTLSIIPAFSNASPRMLSGKKKGGSSTALSKTKNVAKFISGDSLDLDENAAEAYRVLRTSVLLSSAGSPPKTILLTSGQPGEGKTTTACNTAISLCQLGLKVLLIDADLRRPKLHKTMGAKNTRGLSSYLSKQGDLAEIIQPLQIPNLYLMTSGPVPPNPAELLSSDKMRIMLKELAEQYDHIIVDSAPLANLTDSVVLSTMVDGVIIVVHGGKTRRDIVRRVHVDLATVGAKIFGVVLNNLDYKRSGYYDYYYYRYNYGYNYKADIKEAEEAKGTSDYI